MLLDRRLRTFGARYGAQPAHAGLWEAAEETACDVAAPHAVVPMVLEARGLDVSPATIERLLAAGDSRSAAILSRIYRDEVRHVAAGTKWFKRVAESQGFEPISGFQWLIKSFFRGSLKPPFNGSARDEAGLSRDFYEALAQASRI
jgi:uncharacterized ferritin-like protein (DUF455 family)